MDNKTPLNMEEINNSDIYNNVDQINSFNEIPDNDTRKGNIILVVIIIVLSIIITVGTFYIIIENKPQDQISSISK